MTHIRQRFNLSLGYDVCFTRDLFAPENDTLAQALSSGGRKVLICLDSQVAAAHPTLIARIRSWFAHNPHLPPLADIQIVPGGETIKNDPGMVDRLGRLFLEHGLCRHSWVLAIGGGAVLDAVGYATSVTHRGLRLLRAPTTVLSQNDSGMGVKNGVNRFGVKNYYGVFAPPRGVLCDLDLLASLDDRTWSSGVSEAFKVGIIKDRAFLDMLVAGADDLAARREPIAERMIIRAAELHMQHIATGGDPFEVGNSRPLDFGHWSAHKLESLSDFALLHGEAVAIGCALDLHYAALIGCIEPTDARRITLAMQRVGLPIWHALLVERTDDLIRGLDEFREHLGGELTLAMPRPLGTQTDIHHVDLDLLRLAITQLQHLATGSPSPATIKKR